jgi:antitoxin (DNA-binding transcriptional repressor) of toxin-antitoxin stability system
MSITHVDVREAQTRLPELVALATTGTEVILTEGQVPRARLVALVPPFRSRVAGLHTGSMQTTDDFDAPLPEDFWGSSP